MTEVFRSTFLPPKEVDAKPDCMGKAVPGAEVMVLREDSTACEVDEVGELVHRGPTAALGYWNDPEKTERVFRPNPLRAPGTPAAERVVYSGDMVRRDAEGYLRFVSRRDRLIKTLGYRVGPDEIVDALYASGQIAEAAITTEPDERRGDRIVAHVVLSPGGSLDRLRAYARAELPPYMQPAAYAALERIPRLASGKYDIETLRASAGALPVAGSATASPGLAPR
jgi:acyl-coenzyme A synthetase/AMP-(fatty) acid ligase